jgi:hypothetical protein
MAGPDIPTVTLRPTRLERLGSVLSSLVLPTVLIWVAAASDIDRWAWVAVALGVLLGVYHTWSALISRVELRGSTLVARNAFRTHRLSRGDVVAVVETADRLARHPQIAGLELTTGRVLKLTGARWYWSGRTLIQWMDHYGAEFGPYGPQFPARGPDRQGWSGPVTH